MCVIVHKPPEARIPPDLVRAALALNNDGWGLMGFDAAGKLILERHAASEHASIAAALAKHADADLVLHLRQRTRGSNERENAHPFKVAEHLYLMHNGTLPIHSRVAGKSDTWHFVHDILRPLHTRHTARRRVRRTLAQQHPLDRPQRVAAHRHAAATATQLRRRQAPLWLTRKPYP